MKIMQSVLAIAVLTIATSSFAADPALKADNEAINGACASDAATASCGSEKVGTGLLKCLHAYKRSHKEYKFSDSCKSALMKRHADKKAEK